MSVDLSVGFTVTLLDDVRVTAAGAIIGGTPMRVIRLSGAARDVIVDRQVVVRDAVSAALADRLLAGNFATPILDPATATTADLTVIVPIRDRAPQLDRLLTTLGGSLSVVVVDDASHDHGAVASVVHRHRANLVTLTENVGPADARNAGLAQVQTPYVAFVDSDVVVNAATLMHLAGHFVDPKVVAVGPRVRGHSSVDQPGTIDRWDDRWLSLDLGPTPSLVLPWSRVGWLPSACLVARTADVREGFDPTMRVGEDVDLVWRLVKAGHRVRYDPTATAGHDSRPDWRSWIAQRFSYGTSAAALGQRHGDWVAPAVFNPFYGVAALALVAQRRWSAPVAAVCLGVATHRISATLPEARESRQLHVSLAVRGASVTGRQSAQLLLRHWWPITAVLATRSPRARKALTAAAIWDLIDHRDVGLANATDAFLARRAEGLAYGAGLWWGAFTQRSLTPLIPKFAKGVRRQHG